MAEYEEEDELDTLVETGTLEEPCDVMLELKVELLLVATVSEVCVWIVDADDSELWVEVFDEVELWTVVGEVEFSVVDMNDVEPTTLVTGVLE